MKQNSLKHLDIKKYGHLLYDLCIHVFSDQDQAQLQCQSILQNLLHAYPSSCPWGDEKFERLWVFKQACHQMIQGVRREGVCITSSEQIQWDSSEDPAVRLQQFSFYFRRLKVEDQLLILLKDKFQLPYVEIGLILNSPEGALKIRRQHALKTLKEWLWNDQ